jgi:hypothetical protein
LPLILILNFQRRALLLPPKLLSHACLSKLCQ